MESQPPVKVPDRPDEFRETLAERTHENWAAARLAQGWRHGAVRDDEKKEHPSLVPYAQLSEDEKHVDRAVSSGVLDAVAALGYKVAPGGFDVFREYEFIAGSTQFLAERRHAASQTYLTINTAILAIFGLLIKEAGLRDVPLALASLPLIAVGLMACAVWFESLAHYRSLIRWRFEVLRSLEDHPAMRGSQRLYSNEWNGYLALQGRRAFRFSKLEGGLPPLFALLYVLYGVGLLRAINVI